MKKIIVRIFILSICLLVLGAAFPVSASATGVSFKTHLKNIKLMLEKEQYTALANSYFKKQMMYGGYRSEYVILSRSFVRKNYLKPYSFDVIYKSQMTEEKWNEHFTKVSAAKRGIVVAKVLDKDTKEVQVDIDGNEIVNIFQVTRSKGKVMIPGLLTSTLNLIQSLELIP